MSDADAIQVGMDEGRSVEDQLAIAWRRLALVGRLISQDGYLITGVHSRDVQHHSNDFSTGVAAEAETAGVRVEVWVENELVATSDARLSSLDPAAAWVVQSGNVRLLCVPFPISVSDRSFFGMLVNAVDRFVRRTQVEEAARRPCHDLRGALAVIAGQCEMLESGLLGVLSETQMRSVLTIARQGERIRGLV